MDRVESNLVGSNIEHRLNKNAWISNSKPCLKIKKLKRPTTSTASSSKKRLTLSKNILNAKKMILSNNPYMMGTMPVNLIGVYNTAITKSKLIAV